MKWNCITGNHRTWVVFVVIIIFAKGLILYLDPLPMFFLGDSQSYIYSALSGWIPPDRSFVYGLIIKLFALPTHSLTSLIAFQTFLSGISAVILSFSLIKFFRVNMNLAFFLGMLCAIEPLQLLYERYVMTETISLFILAVYLVCVFYYLERPRLFLIALIQIVGTLLLSLRLSFLPLVLANTVIIPFLAISAFRSEQDTVGKRCTISRPQRHISTSFALHFVFSVGLMYTLHSGYKHLNGLLSNAHPAYQYQSGMFLLADWGPIVRPVDFPSNELSRAVFGKLSFNLYDRKTRELQRWQKGGLISNIKCAIPDPYEADRVAKVTAINAIKRTPFGVAHLAVQGFTDYWNSEMRTKSMVTDRGNQKLSPNLRKMLSENFNLPAERLPIITTFTSRYYYLCWPWYLALLCTPLFTIIALFICRPGIWRYTLVLLLVSSETVAVSCALIERPTIRYLHAVGWLVFLIAGALTSKFTRGLDVSSKI